MENKSGEKEEGTPIAATSTEQQTMEEAGGGGGPVATKENGAAAVADKDEANTDVDTRTNADAKAREASGAQDEAREIEQGDSQPDKAAADNEQKNANSNGGDGNAKCDEQQQKNTSRTSHPVTETAVGDNSGLSTQEKTTTTNDAPSRTNDQSTEDGDSIANSKGAQILLNRFSSLRQKTNENVQSFWKQAPVLQENAKALWQRGPKLSKAVQEITKETLDKAYVGQPSNQDHSNDEANATAAADEAVGTNVSTSSLPSPTPPTTEAVTGAAIDSGAKQTPDDGGGFVNMTAEPSSGAPAATAAAAAETTKTVPKFGAAASMFASRLVSMTTAATATATATATTGTAPSSGASRRGHDATPDGDASTDANQDKNAQAHANANVNANTNLPNGVAKSMDFTERASKAAGDGATATEQDPIEQTDAAQNDARRARVEEAVNRAAVAASVVAESVATGFRGRYAASKQASDLDADKDKSEQIAKNKIDERESQTALILKSRAAKHMQGILDALEPYEFAMLLGKGRLGVNLKQCYLKNHGVFVDFLVARGQAESSGVVRAGDLLKRLGEQDLRKGTILEIPQLIAKGKRPVVLILATGTKAVLDKINYVDIAVAMMHRARDLFKERFVLGNQGDYDSQLGSTGFVPVDAKADATTDKEGEQRSAQSVEQAVVGLNAVPPLVNVAVPMESTIDAYVSPPIVPTDLKKELVDEMAQRCNDGFIVTELVQIADLDSNFRAALNNAFLVCAIDPRKLPFLKRHLDSSVVELEGGGRGKMTASTQLTLFLELFAFSDMHGVTPNHRVREIAIHIANTFFLPTKVDDELQPPVFDFHHIVPDSSLRHLEFVLSGNSQNIPRDAFLDFQKAIVESLVGIPFLSFLMSAECARMRGYLRSTAPHINLPLHSIVHNSDARSTDANAKNSFAYILVYLLCQLEKDGIGDNGLFSAEGNRHFGAASGLCCVLFIRGVLLPALEDARKANSKLATSKPTSGAKQAETDANPSSTNGGNDGNDQSNGKAQVDDEGIEQTWIHLKDVFERLWEAFISPQVGSLQMLKAANETETALKIVQKILTDISTMNTTTGSSQPASSKNSKQGQEQVPQNLLTALLDKSLENAIVRLSEELLYDYAANTHVKFKEHKFYELMCSELCKRRVVGSTHVHKQELQTFPQGSIKRLLRKVELPVGISSHKPSYAFAGAGKGVGASAGASASKSMSGTSSRNVPDETQRPKTAEFAIVFGSADAQRRSELPAIAGMEHSNARRFAGLQLGASSDDGTGALDSAVVPDTFENYAVVPQPKRRHFFNQSPDAIVSKDGWSVSLVNFIIPNNDSGEGDPTESALFGVSLVFHKVGDGRKLHDDDGRDRTPIEVLTRDDAGAPSVIQSNNDDTAMSSGVGDVTDGKVTASEDGEDKQASSPQPKPTQEEGADIKDEKKQAVVNNTGKDDAVVDNGDTGTGAGTSADKNDDKNNDKTDDQRDDGTDKASSTKPSETIPDAAVIGTSETAKSSAENADATADASIGEHTETPGAKKSTTVEMDATATVEGSTFEVCFKASEGQAADHAASEQTSSSGILQLRLPMQAPVFKAEVEGHSWITSILDDYDDDDDHFDGGDESNSNDGDDVNEVDPKVDQEQDGVDSQVSEEKPDGTILVGLALACRQNTVISMRDVLSKLIQDFSDHCVSDGGAANPSNPQSLRCSPLVDALGAFANQEVEVGALNAILQPYLSLASSPWQERPIGAQKEEFELQSVRRMTECLPPTPLALMFVTALLEQKIVLSSTRRSALHSVATGLATILRPLKWGHLLAPLVPASIATDLIQYPAPFILGVCSEDAESASLLADLPSDVTLVDLDVGRVILAPSFGRDNEMVTKSANAEATMKALRSQTLYLAQSLGYVFGSCISPDSWNCDAVTFGASPSLIGSTDGARGANPTGHPNGACKNFIQTVRSFIDELLAGSESCSYWVQEASAVGMGGTSGDEATVLFDEDRFFHIKNFRSQKDSHRLFDKTTSSLALKVDDFDLILESLLRCQSISTYVSSRPKETMIYH